MKRIILAIACAVSLSVFVNNVFAQSTARSEVFAGEYIIQRKPLAQPSAPGTQSNFQTIDQTQFVELVRPNTAGYSLQSVAPSTVKSVFNPVQAAIDCEEILKDPTVESCDPNFVQYLGVTPNDPQLYMQYGLCYSFHNGFSWQCGNDSRPSKTSIRAHEGWNYTTGSNNVVIGVIDSGINYNHPDLIPNIWVNPGEIQNNGIDDDRNGYVDDIIGINGHLQSNDPWDCNGHGSHVAGIVGAKGNNGTGVTGVAWNVRIASVKTAPDCGPSVSTLAVIRGMDYFYDLKLNRGVNIVAVNGSYGGKFATQAEYDAIRRMGNVNIVFVAAAGNDGVNIDVDPRYPAAYGLPNMIVVANLDNNNIPNQINSSSNYGINRVHMGAPGTDILSTVQQGGSFDGYDYKTGTSMAAPMVTGAVALLASQRPLYKTARLLKNGILANVYPHYTMQGKTITGGLLDLPPIFAAAQPQDLCPSDPQKIDPGICGCGVADLSPDSDGDFVPNCADQCPSHPGKTAPGVCGCGVPDTDSDADGTPDCIDQCPFLAAKTAPGTCGCGFADVDANKNKKLDCFEATAIASVKPKTPKVATDRKSSKRLVITMTAKKGHYFLVTLTTKTVVKKNGKKQTVTKVKQVKSTKSTLTIAKPSKGTTLQVAYQYVVNGLAAYKSRLSSAKQMKF